MKIELNKSLKISLKNGYIKTVEVVNFLIKKGFKSNLEPEKTSLKMLNYNNKLIKKAYFENECIIIKF